MIRLKSDIPGPASHDRRSAWSRYGWALSIATAATLVRMLLEPALEPGGFALSLAAILVAAWVGGLEASLLAQTLVLCAESLWFHESTEPWRPSLRGAISMAAFYAVGSTVALLSEAVHAAQRRAQAQRNEAASQRERLRATLDCMGDGVLVTDAAGIVTLVNHAAEAMLGRTAEECHDRPLNEVFVICEEESREAVECPVMRVLREDCILRDATAVTLTAEDGRPAPIAYSAAPIRDDRRRTTGVAIVFRDETRRRRHERALREADRRKDEFLATLAHELRNPLAPIRMGLEVMKASDDAATNEEMRAMMERQTQHMVRLIDDLLDVSRITRGKLELRKADVTLGQVVRNALDATRPLIEEAGHELRVDLPAHDVRLHADPNRLTQVISNLLSNAVKFTAPGGWIELAATAHGGEMTVTVRDNGAGIPPDKIDEVFEMFTQVNGSKEMGSPGLGIGLTLVKRLVEMHGGTVRGESAGLGRGSQFSISLPTLDVLDQALAPPDEAPAAAGAKRRVLVVDDNIDGLKTLSMMVRVMGNEVCMACDGLEAVDAAQQFRPDVVLMDLGMPRLNGFDAAERIRREPWGRKVLLVATTGWGQEEARRRSKAAGFDHHLVKPVEPSVLRSLLNGELPRHPPAELLQPAHGEAAPPPGPLAEPQDWIESAGG